MRAGTFRLRNRRVRAGATAVACVVLLVACGEDAGDTQVTESAPAAVASDAPAPVDTSVALPSDLATPDLGGELPLFLGDFSRVCTTQVGFPGAAAYNQEPRVHTIALFEEFENEEGNFIETSRTLPKAWVVTQDADFSDNSELAAIELIGCSDRVAQKPNGTNCDFDDDGKTITVELVDATYEVKVYEATTGEEVGGGTIEAATKECPTIALLDEGQTELVKEPTDDQLIKLLKEFVDL